ncbi:hypothetical protein [Actinomadura sp. 6N118]|uniref:hypothetical protein n=1 Tax=Actinomadura sp. 6N118 TaxID=3375151 RepID=UPI003788525A
MAKLLDANNLQVHPDYRMFGIGDVNAADDGEPPVPGAGWLGVGRSAVLVGVGEQLAYPDVRCELWDGPAPPPPDGHEVQRTVRLHLPTGELTLNEITGGSSDAFGVDPGVYDVRITGWERESTRAAFHALMARDAQLDDPAVEALHGQERYLFQFWQVEQTAGLVTDTGVTIHAGYPRIGLMLSDSLPDRLPAAGAAEVEPVSAGVLIRVGVRAGRCAFSGGTGSRHRPTPSSGPWARSR